MKSSCVAVVLAGGSGTRLWPFSRSMYPKQFMSISGQKSMLHETISRLQPLIERESVWVVTGEDLARGSGYKELIGLNCLLEPSARNTAPAIAIMAAYLMDFVGDSTMLILPADHVIQNVKAFHIAVAKAIDAAENGKIVTFGIKPTRAETGYGYIQATGDAEVLPVLRFVEKPNLETAEGYLKEGGYYWNSGMFVAKGSVMLAEMKAYAPAIYAELEKMREEWRKTPDDWKTVVKNGFGNFPSDSIDYAVMEKSQNVLVVPCDIQWSDVGSWDAVYDISDKDDAENAVQGQAILNDSSRNLVMSQSGRLIATLGVEDLCIVDTDDALLVARKDKVQDVKKVVETLKARGGEEHLLHRTAYRPWGSYTVLDDKGSGFKIKRIEVVPGGRLSLQSHKHRSEHWVVVRGTATVTNGDNVMTLTPGQSTYIPLGALHRLENSGHIPVEIVEVQVGEYLGEDDIQRFDDVYGR